MWKLKEPLFGIVHSLFAGFVFLGVIYSFIFAPLKLVFNLIIYLLFLQGWVYYICSWIYVYLFYLFNKLFLKAIGNIKITLTLASFTMIFIGGVVYYAMFYNYYQYNQLLEENTQEELFIVSQLVIASIITSFLFLKYGKYVNDSGDQ